MSKTKITYHGERIVKKGSKELYPFVYKRIWDLTEYDTNVLDKYGLKKVLCVYIGMSTEYNLRDRCSHWRNEIINNRGVAKYIRDFIKNLEQFYIQETSHTEKEIDELLYYNASIIARCESVEEARKVEKYYTTKYHYKDSYGGILETHIKLLSKKDSNLKDIKNGAISILKAK